VRLDFAMLARAATAMQGELFIQGGLIRKVTAHEFPTVGGPFSIAARLVADHDERGSHHALQLRAFAPSEAQPFFESPTLEFDVEPDQFDPDDPELAVVIGISLGAVPMGGPGTYHFELRLDGEHLVTLPLRAVVGST
jgi:hypothetical protein